MKNKISKVSLPLILIALALLSLGWGSVGHRIISGNIVLSWPSALDFLTNWPALLADHASDADIRKNQDPNEAPKHYIDIDNYNEFITTGRITQNFDSIVVQHGYTFVIDQGILPWAILTTYDSLKSCFARKGWNKAMLFAADLGHYVADAHMPLHITVNYNGQLTNQYGIHSRYESQMIGRYSTQIVYAGNPVDTFNNASDYVFNFIYYNYQYVDSVLLADTYAKSFSSGQYNDTYYQKLWEYSSGFTIYLFGSASHILTTMIHQAWLDAGSPTITNVKDDDAIAQNFVLHQNYPNPFNPVTKIKYSIPSVETHGGASVQNISLKIYDILGNEIVTLVNESKAAGEYEVEFNAGTLKLSSGVYLCKLEYDSFVQTIKLVLMK